MYYKTIPEASELITSTTILSRLIDGLGFRYHWATEGISESDLKFRPSPTSRSIFEVLSHVYELAAISDHVLNGKKYDKIDKIESYDILREKTLELYSKDSKLLRTMTSSELSNCKFQPTYKNKEYPFWNLINGPIADALTHVGQITSWRRINGNPVFLHDPFNGTVG